MSDDRGKPPLARALARRVLERVTKGGAWATLALDGELGRAGLDDRDRRLASELVYGVLRHQSRLDRALGAYADLRRTPPRVVLALRVAAYQLLFLDRVPAHAAVDDAVSAAREAAGGKLAGFANAVLRKLIASGEPPLPDDPRVVSSLPDWIARALAASAGDDRLAELAAAFAQPAPLVARVNLRRTTREALAAKLAETGVTATPIAGAPAALRLEGLGDPSRSPSFVAGEWTVQDTGAQRVAELAAPAAGMRILDACAGVGGKSTHLAELAGDAAVIDAADQSHTKLELLVATARRLGATSIRTHAVDLLDPDVFAPATGEAAAPLAGDYDLIVLDAPCSGLGVLRRHPDAKWRLTEADVPRLARLQAQLLDAVAPRLAAGGALVYSVCTFTRAEGPDQVRALAARAGLEIAAEERTWPPDADAFYVARLVRK